MVSIVPSQKHTVALLGPDAAKRAPIGCRGWCAGGGSLACAGRPAPSCGILGRVPGHPDEGMTSAVGEVLEALNLPETGPLVHGDRPAVERSHDKGIALRPERR